ncbi:MAG: tRNA-binding protein [Chloroflexi bacterium]|nr:tRNA-binding protein [Chloroflexota bacterium]
MSPDCPGPDILKLKPCARTAANSPAGIALSGWKEGSLPSILLVVRSVLALHSPLRGANIATLNSREQQELKLDEKLDSAGETTTIEAFDKIDIRAGRITACEPFPEARKPAYKLTLDFGPLGTKRSSAQLTTLYSPEELVGRLVLAVVNFPSRRIAGFPSEVLVLGLPSEGLARQGAVVLLTPERDVEPGARVF